MMQPEEMNQTEIVVVIAWFTNAALYLQGESATGKFNTFKINNI